MLMFLYFFQLRSHVSIVKQKKPILPFRCMSSPKGVIVQAPSFPLIFLYLCKVLSLTCLSPHLWFFCQLPTTYIRGNLQQPINLSARIWYIGENWSTGEKP